MCRNAAAKEELESGVARLLALWDQSDDLYSVGARKIVDWLLGNDLLKEALPKKDGID